MSYPLTTAEQLAKTAAYERECGEHFIVKAKVAESNGQPALAFEYKLQAELCRVQALRAEEELEGLK